MKYIVTLSTGKDSEATLWWAYHNLKFDEWDVVFNDLDWDDEAVYSHLKYLESRVGKKFITIKSKGYKDKIILDQLKAIKEIFGKENVFAEMVLAKKRFPSTKGRFCTEELKAKPMIDYVLDNINQDCTIIQGVRAEESPSRALMKESDEFFKFYFEPYKYDKNGKPNYHSYRKKDIEFHLNKFSVDVFRPILKKSSQEVFNIIFDNDSPGNSLYKHGHSRVGCYPCVMCRLSEIKIIADRSPERIEQIEKFEKLSGSTFFPALFIPKKYCSIKAESKVYKEDLIKLFGNKKTRISNGQSMLFNINETKNLEERLYNIYFKNEKIQVYLDDNLEEYILRVVSVPTITDVVKYVQKNPNQTDFLPTQSCVSVYNIC